MAKRNSNRPAVTVRELPPRVIEKKDEVQILCPFCEPPHPIAVGRPAACGTTLKVTAVQAVIPARTVNKHNLVCIKCHKSGGQMIQFNQGYIHLHECTPGTKLLTEAPQFSKLARTIFHLPAPLRGVLEKRLGKAKEIKEVDPQGNDTGKVLGYFFYRPTTNGGSHAADR